MSDFFARQVQAIKDTNRKVSQLKRPGIVYEVQKGYCRILMGMSPTGEPYLTPWIPCGGNFLSGSRKSRYIKKNMNVMVHLPNADPSQAYFTPLSQNNEIPLPDHYETAGTEADTYQLENLRSRQDKDTWDWWLTPESGKGQVTPGAASAAAASPTGAKGASGQSQTQPVGQYKAQDTSCGEGTKATCKVRMNKDGGFTARVNGIDIRVAAHKDGAKIRTKSMWCVVTDDDVIVSKPPLIAPDPVANDDK